MVKRLQLVVLLVFFSIYSFAQCDLNYHVAGDPNDVCFVSGVDIQFNENSNNTINFVQIFEVSSSGSLNLFNQLFPNSSSFTWSSVPSGVYQISTYSNSGNSSCVIEISSGQISFNNTLDTLDYCQWNTVNLEDTLSTYFLQNATNPEFTFSVSGTPIDGESYYINNPGINIIDVFILDASGCTVSEQIYIDAEPNNINTQSYDISQSTIQACELTTIDFTINNPDTTGVFSYTWTIDGTTYIDSTSLQIDFDGSISTFSNGQTFDVTLVIQDSLGCFVTYNEQIIAIGSINLANTGSAIFNDGSSPSCAYDLNDTNISPLPSTYFIEIALDDAMGNPTISTPIDEILGPNDTIFWRIACDSAAWYSLNSYSTAYGDILDTFWVYSDLQYLMSPHPSDPNKADVAILEQTWGNNSCDCFDEKYKIRFDIWQDCHNDYKDQTVTKRVIDPVDAEFILTTPLCQNDSVTFQNESKHPPRKT